MYNIMKRHRRWRLMSAILSLSLLTVMAGAAVAPALNLVSEYFSDADRGLVQMIISMPALFIALTSFAFRPLCRRLRARTLVLLGLCLYVIFGCAAGAFSSIWLVLICRALVGVGVGILITSASVKAGRDAAVTVLPLLSAALYLAQFLTPVITGAVREVMVSFAGTAGPSVYGIAMAGAVLYGICSLAVRR